MGRQGSGWCRLNDEGVMVLMSHANYYRLIDTTLYYIGCGHPGLPLSSSSARRSINMLADYFRNGADILLPVGNFVTDGEYKEDDSIQASRFDSATGRVYRAKMLYFDRATGTIACEVVSHFEL
jgi:hypothetical protein